MSPTDEVYVCEITLYQKAEMFARVPFPNFPMNAQSDLVNAAIFDELQLIGSVFSYMAIIIIDHDYIHKW